MRRLRPWILVALAMAFLGGCVVHPQVIQRSQALSQANEDMATITMEQQVPEGPVSLYQAMAWAVRYNRERRVRILETALAQRQFDLAEFDMLPKLTVQAGYTGRDPESASYSESIETGSESLEPSTSQDKARASADVTFTWNMLDFGLSYIQAKQQADRHLIALEKERKAAQILVRDVRKAWWEALSAQRLLKKIAPLAGKVRDALEKSRRIESARLQKPMEALGYQRSLLQILRTLQALRQELGDAGARLATLMGIPGVGTIRVAEPKDAPAAPGVQWDSEAMEQAALIMRPELGQARYQENISRRDVHAALLGVLPSLKLDGGLNWDENSYLMDESWLTYGTRVNWNLFNVFRGPQAMKAAHAKQDVVKEQRLALSMAVLMQVHLAAVNHREAGRLYELSSEYLSVQERILQQVRSMASALEGEQILIREELNQLVAEVRRDKAYAEVQDSFGRILVSIGVDPVPADTPPDDIHALAEAIGRNMEIWRQRDLRRFLELPAVENTAASSTDPLAAHALFSSTPADAQAGLTAAKAPERSWAPTPAEAEMPRNHNRFDEDVAGMNPEPVAGESASAPAEDGTAWHEATGGESDSKAETQPAAFVPEPAPPAAVHDAKTAAAPTVRGYTRFARLHLRKAPSLNAAILAKAREKGEAVEIVEDLGDWLHVAYKGMRGYMFARYVDAPESTLPGRTRVQRVHLRNAPSLNAPIIGKVHDKGTEIAIIRETGDWLHVEHNGHRGYMFARYVQASE